MSTTRLIVETDDRRATFFAAGVGPQVARACGYGLIQRCYFLRFNECGEYGKLSLLWHSCDIFYRRHACVTPQITQAWRADR